MKANFTRPQRNLPHLLVTMIAANQSRRNAIRARNVIDAVEVGTERESAEDLARDPEAVIEVVHPKDIVVEDNLCVTFHRFKCYIDCWVFYME